MVFTFTHVRGPRTHLVFVSVFPLVYPVAEYDSAVFIGNVHNSTKRLTTGDELYTISIPHVSLARIPTSERLPPNLKRHDTNARRYV